MSKNKSSKSSKSGSQKKRDRFDVVGDVGNAIDTAGNAIKDAPGKIKTTYEDIIDTLSVSPSAVDQTSITWQDQLNDYIILFLKYAFLVVLLTLNFLGLSVSLNCNAEQELFTRIASAVFAFFFGFVYLLINYYTYKVMSQGKMCKMNHEKLFPFKV